MLSYDRKPTPAGPSAADPTRETFNYGPPIHGAQGLGVMVQAIRSPDKTGRHRRDAQPGYTFGNPFPYLWTPNGEGGMYEPQGFDLGMPSSISSFLPFGDPFGDAGLGLSSGSVASFLSKVAFGTKALDAIAAPVELILTFVAPEAVPVIQAIAGGIETAATTGKVDPKACEILQRAGTQLIWQSLNGAGRALNHILGDVADVIAILGVMCGIDFYIKGSPDMAMQTTAWLKVHGIQGAAVQPNQTKVFPAGTISIWDPGITMWRNFATPAAIAAWKSAGLGSAGGSLGAVAAPSGTVEIPGASPTAAPGGSTSSTPWGWIALAVLGTAALGGAAYLLLRKKRGSLHGYYPRRIRRRY